MKRRLAKCILLGLGIFGLLLLCWPKPAHGQDVPLRVTLCELGRSPTKFNGQLVSVFGQYESDGIEREGLSDPTCKKFGLALVIGRGCVGKESLDAALRGGRPGTLDKTVRATFIGVFRLKSNAHPPRQLEVQSIEDVAGGALDRNHPQMNE